MTCSGLSGGGLTTGRALRITGVTRPGQHVGTITSIETVRRRRAIRRFCSECKTPWSLTGVRRQDDFVVICKYCGHVRATVPHQRNALHQR